MAAVTFHDNNHTNLVDTVLASSSMLGKRESQHLLALSIFFFSIPFTTLHLLNPLTHLVNPLTNPLILHSKRTCNELQNSARKIRKPTTNLVSDAMGRGRGGKRGRGRPEEGIILFFREEIGQFPASAHLIHHVTWSGWGKT